MDRQTGILPENNGNMSSRLFPCFYFQLSPAVTRLFSSVSVQSNVHIASPILINLKALIFEPSVCFDISSHSEFTDHDSVTNKKLNKAYNI